MDKVRIKRYLYLCLCFYQTGSGLAGVKAGGRCGVLGKVKASKGKISVEILSVYTRQDMKREPGDKDDGLLFVTLL